MIIIMLTFCHALGKKQAMRAFKANDGINMQCCAKRTAMILFCTICLISCLSMMSQGGITNCVQQASNGCRSPD